MQKTEDLDILKTINPHDRQLEFIRAVKRKKFVLYGGAAGGGKSYILRWLLVLLLLWWAGRGIRNVRVGLFCETYQTLKDRHLDRVNVEFPKWLGVFNKTEKTFTLHAHFGGGAIWFRNLDDADKYKSTEFAAIAVDELTLNVRGVFNILMSRLRWTGIEDTKFFAATNPGGLGHAWVKKLWIDHNFEDENLDPNDFDFVPALPIDNPHLTDDYMQTLNKLNDDLRRALLEGNWSTFEGQYFKDWSSAKHIIEPIYLPPEWERGIAVDWGFADPWCALWGARDPEFGRIYVYREMYDREVPDVQQAQRIVAASTYEHRHFAVGDPSMWSRKQADTVSTADTYIANGVYMVPANNDRIPGWTNVREMLLPLRDGHPGVQVFSSCTNLIRTIPDMVYDKTRTEDLNTKAEDHAVDALRYLLGAYRGRVNLPPPGAKKRERVQPAFLRKRWSF